MTKHGPPDVLQVQQRPDPPPPKRGEVGSSGWGCWIHGDAALEFIALVLDARYCLAPKPIVDVVGGRATPCRPERARRGLHTRRPHPGESRSAARTDRCRAALSV